MLDQCEEVAQRIRSALGNQLRCRLCNVPWLSAVISLGCVHPFQPHAAAALHGRKIKASSQLDGQHVLAAALLTARRRRTGILRW